MKYDFLLVGAGLFNLVVAKILREHGRKALIIEKRNHPGGNIFCEEIAGINVHKYGAHIFHTSDKEVWEFVTGLCEFNNFINTPVANFHGEIYNLPFNMNTFNRIWGVVTPTEARDKIAAERKKAIEEFKKRSGISPSAHYVPQNLEEQAISLVGRSIYEKLIKGYTEKQWGRDAGDLPGFIIKRLPVRFIYDNNYFNDRFQGIPLGGYNVIIDKLLDGSELILDCDFNLHRDELLKESQNIIYTGPIDEYFDFCLGRLDYRSLRFETKILDMENFQGSAVVNYTDRETPFTRIIEHKHFEFGTQEKTVVTREYPATFGDGMERYYPVNDDKNQALYSRYTAMADSLNVSSDFKVYFKGRLGEYKYYDMDDVIRSAFDFCAGLKL